MELQYTVHMWLLQYLSDGRYSLNSCFTRIVNLKVHETLADPVATIVIEITKMSYFDFVQSAFRIVFNILFHMFPLVVARFARSLKARFARSDADRFALPFMD